MNRHGRADLTLVTLWLYGFDIPLPRLRRAWMSTRQEAGKGRISPSGFAPPGLNLEGDVSDILLNAMFSLAGTANTGAASDDAAAVRLIAHALAKIDMGDQDSHGNTDTAGLWRLLRMLAADAHVDALVIAADEEELHQARHYLLLAARVLQDGSMTGAWITEHMARPLFSLAVVMLRSGRGGLLARLASRVEDMDRRSIAQPVHVLHG